LFDVDGPFSLATGDIMQRANVLGAVLFLAGASLCAVRGQAQTTVGADLGLFSSYVWRGLSLTNKPVAQPDVYITIPAGNASVTAGGWFNIDLGKYDNASDISESGGTSAVNFAEFDPWLEVGIPVGKATLTPGITAYIYPNSAGFTSDFNTVEVYLKAALDAPLSPKVSLYYDVDKVKGLYAEGSITHSLAASEKVSVNLGALVGVNAGQGVSTDPSQTANFSDDGFTHFDLSAGVPFTAGVLSITPVLHLVIPIDDFTKITKFDATTGLPVSKDAKLWGGVSLAWSKALGPEPEATDEAKP
jgi:uncharacterized protein Gcw-chp